MSIIPRVSNTLCRLKMNLYLQRLEFVTKKLLMLILEQTLIRLDRF